MYNNDEKNREMIAEIQLGDNQALEELINLNMPMVKAVVRDVLKGWSKSRRSNFSSDLQQEGVIALIESSRKFNLESKTIFYSYAKKAIYRRVVRKTRDMLIVSIPSTVLDCNMEASKAAFSLEAIGNSNGGFEGMIERECCLTSDGGMSQIENVEDMEFVDSISDMVDAMPEMLARCVKLRHGYEKGKWCCENSMSYREMGHELGISHVWARVVYTLAQQELKMMVCDMRNKI
jgi:RNA polymerase sigma factor (sigma-70 family)